MEKERLLLGVVSVGSVSPFSVEGGAQPFLCGDMGRHERDADLLICDVCCS